MPLDHYISQVYLRNFYSPVLGERMYGIRKRDLKSFTPDSKSVCRIEDGSTNTYLREDRTVEEFLKTIEPKYNAALAKLTEDRIDSESIYTIGGFVAHVLCCSPAAMRIHSGPLRSIVEKDAAMLEARGKIPPAPSELGGKSLVELLRAGTVRINIDPKYPQAIGISSLLHVVAKFGNFAWEILLNDFPHSPFFTSDFPVAIEETHDPRILDWIVPLAPNLAIRIRPDPALINHPDDYSFANFSHRSRNASYKEVVKINRLIVRCAEEKVFYRDDSAWVEKFIAKNRNYRIETITNKIPRGNGLGLYSTLSIVPFNPPENGLHSTR